MLFDKKKYLVFSAALSNASCMLLGKRITDILVVILMVLCEKPTSYTGLTGHENIFIVFLYSDYLCKNKLFLFNILKYTI